MPTNVVSIKLVTLITYFTDKQLTIFSYLMSCKQRIMMAQTIYIWCSKFGVGNFFW